MGFKDHWTLENALKVLQHPTVDAKLWAEAVEWLLLYGPPEIQMLLLHASGTATKQCFPELTAEKYTEAGQPCYDIAAIAEALGIDAQDAYKTLAEKEMAHQIRHFIEPDDTYTVH